MVYIREKDKIEKYVEALAKKFSKNCNCKPSFGVKSRYYRINGKVLRISDHVGNCSDAHISIILPSFKTGDNYLIHSHGSGMVSVISYDIAKELVRSFFYLATFMTDTIAKRDDIKEDKEEKNNLSNLLNELKNLEKYKEEADKKQKTILGLPLIYFSDGQLKEVERIVNNAKKKFKLV